MAQRLQELQAAGTVVIADTADFESAQPPSRTPDYHLRSD